MIEQIRQHMAKSVKSNEDKDKVMFLSRRKNLLALKIKFILNKFYPYIGLAIRFL